MKRLIIAVLLVFTLLSCGKLEYRKSAGKVFGTYYAITYEAREDLTPGMREVMGRVNKSLSTFDSTSVISKVNANKDVVLDTLFINMFNKAQEISAITSGAFDITVAPLVNAWGFGFDPSSDKKWLSASFL